MRQNDPKYRVMQNSSYSSTMNYNSMMQSSNANSMRKSYRTASVSSNKSKSMILFDICISSRTCHFRLIFFFVFCWTKQYHENKQTNKQTNYVTFLEIFLYPLPIPLTMTVLSSLSTSNLNDTPTNSLIRRNNYSVLFIIDNILWWNYWIIDPYESLRHRRERTQRVANGDTDEGNQYNLLYKSLPITTSHSFSFL